MTTDYYSLKLDQEDEDEYICQCSICTSQDILPDDSNDHQELIKDLKVDKK